MTKVLTKRILKWMRGSIDVARGPSFVTLGPKDPCVVFLKFNYKDSRASDKDGINLSSAAFIRNDNVLEAEQLESPRDCFENMCLFKKAARCWGSRMARGTDPQRDEQCATYQEHDN